LSLAEKTDNEKIYPQKTGKAGGGAGSGGGKYFWSSLPEQTQQKTARHSRVYELS
jgi:hypothetical protein